MLKVLTVSHYFLPGYKAGGPIRTLSNLVDNLGREIDFSILTSDRDFGDSQPYQNLQTQVWTGCRLARVCYIKSGLRRVLWLSSALRQTSHDVLYLNSLFDAHFTLWPLLLRRLGLSQTKPVILAPRGELSPGALSIKTRKKSLFLSVAKLLGLYRGAIWQASSDYEAADIRSFIGQQARIIVAPNLPSNIPFATDETLMSRQTMDPLRLAFLSRIAPKKNLDFALRVLRSVKVPVVFNLYGPEEDAAFTAECRRLAGSLPAHVQVSWHGAIHPEEVSTILASHDLFFFPTRGENYGHVIAEALSVGTPVLLSDTTPWRDLEAAGVGWDLPLDEEAAFARCIEKCAQRTPGDYATWREQVRDYARRQLDLEAIVEANRRLFLTAAGRTQVPEVDKG